MDWKKDESRWVKEFLANGLVSLAGIPALSAEEVQACKEASCMRFAELSKRLLFLSNLHGSHPSTGNGTLEVVERDGARFDMRYRMDEDPFRSLAQNGPWKSLVTHLLGERAKLMWAGVVVAKGEGNAEAGPQAWHRDGEHLFDGEHSPPHCINVFLPLVDVDASNGSTEFVLGSHVFGQANRPSDSASVCKPSLKAGEALLFDYRCVHRGGANSSREDRHVLYFTYAREWFVDMQNHRSSTSLFDESFDFSATHAIRAEFEACLASQLLAKQEATRKELDHDDSGQKPAVDSLNSEADASAEQLGFEDAWFETEITLGDMSHTLRVPTNGVVAAVQSFCKEHQLPPELAALLEQQLHAALLTPGATEELADVDAECVDPSSDTVGAGQAYVDAEPERAVKRRRAGSRET